MYNKKLSPKTDILIIFYVKFIIFICDSKVLTITGEAYILLQLVFLFLL